MITTETHDHALTCEITQGRGCDCGLTGMAGVAFYSSGVAVYKTPTEKRTEFLPGGKDSQAYADAYKAMREKRLQFFGRYNSALGVAINLGRIGSPVRESGAASPEQAEKQDAFVKSLSATNEVLERILDALKKPDA